MKKTCLMIGAAAAFCESADMAQEEKDPYNWPDYEGEVILDDPEFFMLPEDEDVVHQSQSEEPAAVDDTQQAPEERSETEQSNSSTEEIYPEASEQPTDEYIGYIQGYRLTSESGSHTYGRGLTPFEKGDVVTPLFDFYDAQGNYSNTIKGSEITINSSSDLEVRYELFDHNTVHFWGTMTTVYGDQIDTSVIVQ